MNKLVLAVNGFRVFWSC